LVDEEVEGCFEEDEDWVGGPEACVEWNQHMK